MLRNVSRTTNYISNLGGYVKFPHRLKGTVMEKWASYWKNLIIDYRQMLQDMRTDIQEEPRKAMIWISGLGTLYALAKNNPDELEFRDSLKRIDNEVVMISEKCQNPKAAQHLRFLDLCYNQGVLHYQSFGIASVMYTTDMTEGCDLYKTQCKYLQPTYFSFPSKIVDIGFMGRWWNLYIKTTNYDVNHE